MRGDDELLSLADGAFFAAVSGARLEPSSFQIAPGLTLRQVYGHVMSPYVVATKRPARPGLHHPGPWTSVDGGAAYDCEFEIEVAEGYSFGQLHRLNAAWMLMALLRLRSAMPVRAPILANVSLAALASTPASQVRVTPMEMSLRQRQTKETIRRLVTQEDLEWVRDHFGKALQLLEDERFARAFDAYDGAVWQHSDGAAILVLWAAIEALMRPGRPDTTKRLARVLSAYLTPGIPVLRQMYYDNIVDGYHLRGGAAHAARMPDLNIWWATQLLARPAFIQCIEDGVMPDPEALLADWKAVASGQRAEF